MRRRRGLGRALGTPLKALAAALLAAAERRGARCTLIDFLAATGEYDGIVARLELHDRRLRGDLRRERLLALWYEDVLEEARSRLGSNFSGVGTDGTCRREELREDRFLQARGRDEYLVNHLAGELLSRRNREAAKAAEIITLLLPGCMRVPARTGCAAERAGADGLGLRCRRCSPDCPVAGMATEETERLEVRILLHGSSFRGSAHAVAADESRAVIGVACVPNLISGGEAARELNLPSLCVPLAYPGCAAHWLKRGVPTVPEEGLLRRRLAEAGCCGSRSAAAPPGSARVLQL